MAVKSILVLCAAACFVKIIAAQQCLGSINNVVGTAIAAEELALAGNALAYGAGNAFAYGPGNALACNAYGAGNLGFGAPFAGQSLGYGYAANTFAPTSGGGFAVQSISPFAPTGITVISENAIEGALAINGNLPFLGAIALEGALPSCGAGGINYGCGNGAVGIVSEGISPAVGPAAYPAGLGYANGLAGGLGYGAGLGNGLGYNGRPGLGLGGCGALY